MKSLQANKDKKMLLTRDFFGIEGEISYVCTDDAGSEGYFGLTAGLCASGNFERFSRFCVLKAADRQVYISGDVFQFESQRDKRLVFFVGTQHDSYNFVLHFRCQETKDFHRIFSSKFLSESFEKINDQVEVDVNSEIVFQYMSYMRLYCLIYVYKLFV